MSSYQVSAELLYGYNKYDVNSNDLLLLGLKLIVVSLIFNTLGNFLSRQIYYTLLVITMNEVIVIRYSKF